MTTDWREDIREEREDLLDAISIDGRVVAQAIDDRPGITGRVYEAKESTSLIPSYAWLFGRKLKMHDLGLKRRFYLGADGHVYRRHTDINHKPYFKRAQIDKRLTEAGIWRVHQAILRLAE